MDVEMQPKYITDIIEDDYTKWTAGDIILITAPTGSGKSTFIFDKLLEYAIQKNQPILYLVNRSSLKSQLERKLRSVLSDKLASFPSTVLINPGHYFSIRTYQSIESSLENGNTAALIADFQNYAYIVYDECHYFLADSTIENSGTCFSYYFLTSQFDCKIQIFMSATMWDMQSYFDPVERIISMRDMHGGVLMAGSFEDIIYQKRCHQPYIFRYPKDNSIQPNYDYIDLYGFTSKEDIPDLIARDQEKKKWLIFVDSITTGHTLMNNLQKGCKPSKKTKATSNHSDSAIPNFKDDEIIFINAGNQNKERTAAALQSLNTKEMLNERIVIATSVLDNGVSFHDNDLKNVVILADNKEEFIQMLGRKRVNKDEKINLYICKQSPAVFQKRLAEADAALNTYYEYADDLHQILQYPANQVAHKRILRNLMAHESVYRNLKKFVAIFHGTFILNVFSIKRLANMRNFYKQMIEKMDADENAFLREQASWLNYSNEQINGFIAFASLSHFEQQLQAMERILDEYVNYGWFPKGGPKPSNRDLITQLSPCLKSLVTIDNGFDAGFIKTIEGVLSKNDRPLTHDNFNSIMHNTHISLGFEMKQTGQKENTQYRIVKTEVKIDL